MINEPIKIAEPIRIEGMVTTLRTVVQKRERWNTEDSTSAGGRKNKKVLTITTL